MAGRRKGLEEWLRHKSLRRLKMGLEEGKAASCTGLSVMWALAVR